MTECITEVCKLNFTDFIKQISEIIFKTTSDFSNEGNANIDSAEILAKKACIDLRKMQSLIFCIKRFVEEDF